MKFEGLQKSSRKNKRFMIIFSDPKLIVHFGDINGSTYIDHKDKIKRDNYIKRHSVNENWDEMNPGSASRFILWGDSSNIDKNVKEYLKRFGVK